MLVSLEVHVKKKMTYLHYVAYKRKHMLIYTDPHFSLPFHSVTTVASDTKGVGKNFTHHYVIPNL